MPTRKEYVEALHREHGHAQDTKQPPERLKDIAAELDRFGEKPRVRTRETAVQGQTHFAPEPPAHKTVSE